MSWSHISYFKLIYFGVRRRYELLWFVTRATKAKIAIISSSSQDPSSFDLSIDGVKSHHREDCKALACRRFNK